MKTGSSLATPPAVRPSCWYDAYFFDLDGTIYLGDEALPGAVETIACLRRRGVQVRFLSNNPTKSPQQYVDKLAGMGIATTLDEITTSITTTVWWLTTYHREATIFPIAEEPLCQALREAGFRLSDDPSQIDIVIASYDRGFDYAKLQTAFDALWYHKRAILIQTNPDRYCPFPDGRGQPDAAAITAAIEACAQVPCQASMGKPSPLLLEAGLAGLDLPHDRCIMTGDRLGTDIRMAIDAHMPAAVVFTGEARPEDLTALHADVFRLNSINQLLPG
ncbi:MAG: HAD hydrolase-like protein [Propionibacteriaceae bacterium]|nr:HAD hydrolase-like protein [Propionibacteriaceae bacterium]